MAIFKYEILNKKGVLDKGSIAAITYDHAAKKLVGAGGQLIKLEEEKPKFWEKFLKVQKREVITFTRGLATLQKAGVPMLESLNSLMDISGNPKMRRVQQDIIMSIESGESLSGSLARFPKVFEKLFIAMIRVAEASGKLDEVLKRLYETYEKEEDLKSQLKSAMAYPVVVSLAITGIIFFILTFVVPKFVQTFSSMEIVMPLPTQILIKVSYLLRTKMYILLPFLLVMFFFVNKVINLRHIKVAYDAFKLRLPVLGSLIHKVILGRFTNSLQVLLASGVPIIESLDLVSSTLGNEVVIREVQQMSNYVSKGGSITDYLKLKKTFPSMVVQMISIGEDSGNLAAMLGEVSNFYENETQRALKMFLTILEPLMIVTMGLLVGGILITLMMPLFSMMSGFRI